MKKEKVVQEYCSGCGLCHSLYNIELKADSKGFLVPLEVSANIDKLALLCPSMGAATHLMDAENMWGTYKSVYLGWSADKKIRKQASSGGILTTLCCYLLEEGKVDGIIQTVEDGSYHTKTVVSRTKEDVLECMGSRYSISAPLYEIKQMIEPDKVYAFVGKPCDATAIRNALNNGFIKQENIKYIFSFFCAGTPGNDAQKKLMRELKCEKEEDCLSLQYRGNGWPGFATLRRKDGMISQMSYNDSWGNILGRDVRRLCRFCVDGIGEMADISCGDAWYLDGDKNPVFTENEGRNVIFARTDIGQALLMEAKDAGYIVAEDYENIDDLKYIQKYQYERKATLASMIKALKLCRKEAPAYSRNLLESYSKNVNLKLRARRFAGTVKRACKGKI